MFCQGLNSDIRNFSSVAAYKNRLVVISLNFQVNV